MNAAIVNSKDSKYYKQLVSAADVENGNVSRFLEFVDPEYEFRVDFVKHSKNDRSEHFRLYYSLDDYKKMNPERQSQYDYVRNLQHFTESEWHRDWTERFSFAETEKYIRNQESGRYRRTDAYLADVKTCVEFQHSFDPKEFDARNAFYDELGLNIIWLFDLSSQWINPDNSQDGVYTILESNDNSFFRLAQLVGRFEDYPVFIEDKSGFIYQVKELGRKDTDSVYQATVRIFEPFQRLTKEQFINKIVDGDILMMSKPFLKATGNAQKYDEYLKEKEEQKARVLEEKRRAEALEAERLETLRKIEESRLEAARIAKERQLEKERLEAEKKAIEEAKLRAEAEALRKKQMEEAAQKRKIKESEEKAKSAERKKLYEAGQLDETIIAEALAARKCPICGSRLEIQGRKVFCCSLYACGYKVKDVHLKYVRGLRR